MKDKFLIGVKCKIRAEQSREEDIHILRVN